MGSLSVVAAAAAAAAVVVAVATVAAASVAVAIIFVFLLLVVLVLIVPIDRFCCPQMAARRAKRGGSALRVTRTVQRANAVRP